MPAPNVPFRKRVLTARERATLVALIKDTTADLRSQADRVWAVGHCGCGCPSIDFAPSDGRGMKVIVDAAVLDSDDSLFVFTYQDADGREVLGGIEYVWFEDRPPQILPPPERIHISGPTQPGSHP